MCLPTTSNSNVLGNDEAHRTSSSSSPSQQVKSKIVEGVLRNPVVDWTVVNGLLQQLAFIVASASATNNFTFTSTTEQDPLGRSFVSSLLARNPPPAILNVALQVFPESLRCNPVAFFTACRFASSQTVTQMMNHCLRTGIIRNNDKNEEQECPYPWILSNHISADGAKAILQAYPQGVLQRSSSLSGGFCPLDFFLMSPEMAQQRKFDMNMWTKFKLILVAAERCGAANSGKDDIQKREDNGLSPVHVILKRIMSRPDILDDMDTARHVLWLLHQLRRGDKWVFQKRSSCSFAGDDDRLLYPLHFVLSHSCTKSKKGLVASRELVKILLSAYPSSSRLAFEDSGRLPIHMAVVNGWPCHDLLLSVYPESLDIQDPMTGFVPFLGAAAAASVTGAAATTSHGDDDNGAPGLSLDMTFELFKANPVHADLSARA